ncbi:hypothetical protein TNIN_277081 [Trichonephila inaurata madagascariensis]|uniref:F-box domain-containing protein n=1 Tax=Trichonephila inaurata madagascariensis TaxID=2747483 RepID=A0A8X6WQW0_9ARAC|nr:hypothetical protein TNIN_277081 [Trichonephila inaurata madagascariensis]
MHFIEKIEGKSINPLSTLLLEKGYEYQAFNRINMENEFDAKPLLLKIPWVDVLFCHVFSKLSPQDLFNLRAVNKEIKFLVSEYFKVNRVLNFSSVTRSATLKAFQIITKDAHNLRIIDLNCCKWLDSTALNPVLESNKNLLHLNISSCISVSNSSLQILANNASELKVLDLSNCHWTSAGAIISIALNCPMLEFIDLTSCWEVTDEAVCELVLNCPRYSNGSFVYDII